MGPDAMILVFWMLSFRPTFSLSSFTFIKRLFSSSLSAKRVVSSAYLRLLIFLLAILIPVCASSSNLHPSLFFCLKYCLLGVCSVSQICPALCDPMDCNPPGSSLYGISQAKNTGVGCHFLLQGIFPTLGLNWHLLNHLHCRWILYHWATGP